MSAWMSGENYVELGAGNTPLQSAIRPIVIRPSAICLVAFLLLLSCAPSTLAQSSARQQTPQPTPGILQVEALLQQDRLDEAKAAVQAEIQRNPGSIEAYNLLGIIASDQQNLPDAVAAFQRALQLAPNAAKTHNNLGNAYVAEKEFDSAEKEFRTVLRLDPSDPEGNYNLGVLLMTKGSPTEAIVHLERVHPPNLPTKVKLIQATFQAKRTIEALHMSTDLSAQNPNDIQLHFSLGILLAAEKQYKAAQLELEKADALRPGTFEIPFSLGQVFLRTANYPKAELSLDRALKVKPDSADTLSLLAQAYQGESRPLDALDLLVRAHKLAPDNIDITYLMAQVSISQSYFEDAIPLLESALVIAPRRPDLLAALGESYFMSGKVDKAIEVFNKLIEVDPSARSYAYLGLSYRHLGRFEEATQYFDKGLKLDPHNSSCLFNLGFIAERQGDIAKAERLFKQVLLSNPDYSDALLELANLKIANKQLPEAAELLRRFVRASQTPATGYYKLAMVERSLRQTDAADRDLGAFQTLSKNAPAGAYPYEHLFDYLDNRSKLTPDARAQFDIAELNDEIAKHPDQPEDLYLLAEAYLKSGKVEEARMTIVQLDKISASDFRTLTGVGVLLARYHLYDDAIAHFKAGLEANPHSDEVKFNLADAYFKKRLYRQALDTAQQVSDAGRKDDAYLALLGDINAHLGNTAQATELYHYAIGRNPDSDQDYLALALLQLRSNNILAAEQTLLAGQARIPGSGKLLWGLGIVSILEGNTPQAADRLERAVEILPEWPGSYSTLGVFYYQTGQIEKAKEVLDRFKNSNAGGSLDVNRIEQVLAQAPASVSNLNEPLSMAGRAQLLQLALSLADRTL